MKFNRSSYIIIHILDFFAFIGCISFIFIDYAIISFLLLFDIAFLVFLSNFIIVLF